MKYYVLATPPASYNLSPRIQLKDSKPHYYEDQQEAIEQAKICNEVARSDKTGWSYKVDEIKCDCHSPETLAAEKVYSEVLAQNKKETTKRILAIK